MTPLDTAAAVLAVLLYLAAVALVGVPMAREWLCGRLGGPLQARDGAAAPSAPSEGQGGPLAGVSAEDSHLRPEWVVYRRPGLALSVTALPRDNIGNPDAIPDAARGASGSDNGDDQ